MYPAKNYFDKVDFFVRDKWDWIDRYYTCKKIDYDTYKYTHSSTEYYILNINRVFEDCGYIISASLKIYRNGNLKIDVNLKRD